MKNDQFANIAASGIGGRSEFLYTPSPEKRDIKICKAKNGDFTPIKTNEKISTKEQLYSELSDMREKYKPYLNNFAPAVQEYKKITDIKNFRMNGEDITIPDFSGPSTYALKVYETTFNSDEVKSDEAAYICFDGADYIAHVYINDVCVGTHEGFFSPFEFEITRQVKSGTNKLKIELYNDTKYLQDGDKLYAATGLGWDGPYDGWHHCPSGIGIYNSVRYEIRKHVNITDIFVRPFENCAEVWVEIENSEYKDKDVEFEVSVYGRNFKETVFEDLRISPKTTREVGRGDTFTEARVKDEIGKGFDMPAKHGKNIYKFMIDIPGAKLWDLSEPNLYQINIKAIADGTVCDTSSTHFGMRTFTQDTESTPKGMFYLNGRKIRLRGANTMGFEQQDVMNGDFEQLIDDILLAKLCNMNFLRLTQRPVQKEVYDYCDMLGLMTQTDLPLFGCMRRTKFAEGVRQAEEMEKLIRSHPCNIMVTYINEPFPNANNQPHRHLTRDEMEMFFEACDSIVHLNNPDRVIKHVDGDYDPPTTTLPDNHCYPTWYNSHGIDIGKLNKGYWLSIMPDWYCGCGEYGTEGMDFPEIMREYYPKEWIKEPFDISKIHDAQTAPFHYFFYDTQETIEDWSRESQKYQAFATTFMSEALRRNRLMITNAIHLFIDAWPDGWMKTIMDFKRNPKPAYFAYRNAMEPVHISLRTDRFTYFAGETVNIESYICNDSNLSGACRVVYEVYKDGKIILQGESDGEMKNCDVTYCSDFQFSIDSVCDREVYTVKAILVDNSGNVLAHNFVSVEIFEDCEVGKNDNLEIITLTPGVHEVAGEMVTVKECGMLPLHFVSRKTGHSAVDEFKPEDFRYWYNKDEDMITPIITSTFEAEGFSPILTSGNTDDEGSWHNVLACGEKVYNGKRYVICQVDLRCENPIAKRFLRNINKD